ncbi:DUF4254 domain-containing protein [Nocardia suismassiliense]|uniref:DUF4254 domain-containing protein n=1 Tax=Nocardia suismassiliense TaxID=2077092 RepID=A0ABW6R066_9NOCA
MPPNALVRSIVAFYVFWLLEVKVADRAAFDEGDRWLRGLYAARETIADRRHIDQIDVRRARLVRDIDRWVTLQLPPSHGAAYIHTETVGAVIDRLAQFTACAFAALASASQWELGDAWEQLAELAVGYDDLAAEVCAGRRRLPGGP